MRTDTATFASRVFKQVRALGISCARSKEVARSITSGNSGGSYNPYGNCGFQRRATVESLDLILNVTHEGFHYVEVIVDGDFAFSASTRDRILVNVEPTARQLEIYEDLCTSRDEVREAIAEACRQWEAEFGYPANDEQADARYDAVALVPAVIDARARYNAIRDQSLALNPHAPAWVIDPVLFATYSDEVKYERGSRPAGYTSFASVRRYFETSNENSCLQQAA